MTIIYTAVAVLGLGAVIGMYMLSLIIGDKRPPKAASFIHGLFAVLGLGLLISYWLGNAPGPTAAIIIFVIAALGGATVWWKDITGQKIPKWLALLHGIVAVGGYAALLIFAFVQNK